MPVLETKGALSTQGYGLTTSIQQRNYIEDVFSTWLYTGTGASRTITNNIALSTNGGMVWMKSRSAATDHAIYDTTRGATFDIASNLTTAQTTQATGLTAFGTTGFTIGALAKINTSAATYASWTFRKQAKFFNVVTYTGTGANRTIAHDLGSVPGCIFVKQTSGSGGDWQVYHRSIANTEYLVLNTNAAVTTSATIWASTTPTSSVFSVGTDATVNASGETYVAYLFAHNAGGFGNAGTDDVISCGSFATSAAGSTSTIDIGYEPQWIFYKSTTIEDAPANQGNWQIVDSLRGLNSYLKTNSTVPNEPVLFPNTSNAEVTWPVISISATGFKTTSQGFISPSKTFIYIAVRRGPMKTPTVGTSVYQAIARTATGANATISSLSFPSDASWFYLRSRAGYGGGLYDRLRGANNYLLSFDTLPENNVPTTTGLTSFASNVGFTIGVDNDVTVANTFSGDTGIIWNFRRAPGLIDEVCYAGGGSNTTQKHNLGVVPELIIVKGRSGSTAWQVYSSILANTEYLVLNTTAAKATDATRWNSTTPTSTVFSLGTASEVNTAGATYVAYLFATVASVSKVGSYTGTGTTLAVNCGFTTGARFVLVKRTDLVGDWYVWDSTRGIVAANDPYLLLNSTAAEVTTTDWVDTAASGFELSNSVGNLVNVVGGTYLFLSIA